MTRFMRCALVITTVAFVGACSGLAEPDCPPPEIVSPVDDQVVVANDTLILDLHVLEPTGDEQWSFAVEPEIEGIYQSAGLYQSGGSGTFRWRPLASDASSEPYTFRFYVESCGALDSVAVQIEVTPAGGAPRFIMPPPGGTFDLGVDPCVVVNAEVIDEDSTNVAITEAPPLIDGGTLTQLDGHRARWEWCPSPEQVEESLQWTLHLEADDGDHEPVQHEFEIVLVDEG